MKNDLRDCTFIIPLRIESDDRLRNIITVICYLLGNFDTNIIVKEVDEESIFSQYALPQINEFLDGKTSTLTHIFEQSEDPVFFREKILNEMLFICDTKVVVNYDCDVVFPPEVLVEAYSMIMKGTSDVVYPYGQGKWQYKVSTSDELVSEFLNNDFDLKILEAKSSEPEPSDYGWVQFFDRHVYIEGGMENENFIGSAPDDFERHFRYSMLGYKVHRIDNFIYHLEHSRGMNSWPTSYHQHPHTRNNMILWEELKTYDKIKLKEYYSKQKYLKKYIK